VIKQNSQTSSKLHMIYCIYLLIMLDTLLLGPSVQFTTLHPTTHHPITLLLTTLVDTSNSSHLNFTQLHFTSLHFATLQFPSFKLHPTTLNPISISYRHISPHITTLHLTSLHCTIRRFSPHFYSFIFTPFIIAFITQFLKTLGLQGTVTGENLIMLVDYAVRGANTVHPNSVVPSAARILVCALQMSCRCKSCGTNKNAASIPNSPCCSIMMTGCCCPCRQRFHTNGIFLSQKDCTHNFTC
jgi:hypothetical protein